MIITDLQTRKNIVIANRLCYSYLKSGHNSKNCRSKFRCKHCSGRHHSSLCEQETCDADSGNQEASDEITDEASALISLPSLITQDAVFLQTAKTTASNPDLLTTSIQLEF